MHKNVPSRKHTYVHVNIKTNICASLVLYIINVNSYFDPFVYKFTVLSDAADCLLWKLVVEMVLFKGPALCSLLSVSLVFVWGKVPAAIFSTGDILVECVVKLSVLEWCRFIPASFS
jgi:hypothetical protein